jgi:hypothetical protein
MTVAPAPVSSNPFTAFLSQNAGDEPLLLKLEISSPIKALQHPASKPTSLKAASLDDGLFLHCPLRLLDTDDDEVVHLGSWSKADNPAPGPRKAGAGDKSAQTSPATSHTTLETSASGDGDLPTPLEDMAVDPYPGLDGLDPRFLRLLTNAPAEDAASSPWSKYLVVGVINPSVCSCGTPNIAGPTYCQR